jgi:hypothetical protein
MKLKLFTITFIMLAMTGCYQKHLVFQAEAVSMTEKNSGKRSEMKIGKEIEEKWCTSEEPVYKPSDKDIGMADQVIYKAQDGGKRADFITEARVFRDSDGCAIITGRIAKLK